MTARVDMTGQKYGRWTVREYLTNKKWLCVCECGNTGEVFGGNLRRGLSKSCGCLHEELRTEIASKAGKASAAKNLPPEKKEERRLARLEREKAKRKVYREANKERLSEGKRRCYQAKRDQYLARIKANYEADPEKVITRERKKATLREEATPAWADPEAIKELYRQARRMTKESGIRHHVDHIVPLRHPLVCGLHVETNLRVIPAVENWRKHNAFEV